MNEVVGRQQHHPDALEVEPSRTDDGALRGRERGPRRDIGIGDEERNRCGTDVAKQPREIALCDESCALPSFVRVRADGAGGAFEIGHQPSAPARGCDLMRRLLPSALSKGTGAISSVSSATSRGRSAKRSRPRSEMPSRLPSLGAVPRARRRPRFRAANHGARTACWPPARRERGPKAHAPPADNAAACARVRSSARPLADEVFVEAALVLRAPGRPTPAVPTRERS